MKPPICEICNVWFDNTDEHLVAFRRTDRGAAFNERQRTEGIVGHQPDDAWFCPDHLARARELALDGSSLAEALAEIRGVPVAPEIVVERADPAVPEAADDLGCGYRFEDVDGSGGIEWPLEWLTALDISERFATLAPIVARALGGPDQVELVTSHSRANATVEGAGPDDEPYVDIVDLSGESSTTEGVTRVEIRHRQKHLRDDVIIEVQLNLSVQVTTPAGRSRTAALVAWGYVSDDRCNLMRLTKTNTGPVVEFVRAAFELGTDRWTQQYLDGDPVCVSCGNAFDQATGGRAVFRVDAAGQDWNTRMRRGEVEGDRPYNGWFCNRHIGPAQLVSSRLSKMEAMPLLVPEGRAPLEYREHPSGVEIDANEFGEPSRAPFMPVVDTFEPTWIREVQIAPRIVREVHGLLVRAMPEIGRALGADRFRSFGGNSTCWSHQSGEFSAFLFADGRAGLTLQQRERTVFDLRVRTADPVQQASDGERLLERVEIRAASDEIAAQATPAVEALLAELSGAAADPFDLVPDLVDVDLRGGELRRGLRPGVSYLDWDIDPTDIGDMAKRLLELVGPLAALLGVDEVPELVGSTERSYSPMDGAVAPNCPYEDRTRKQATVAADSGEMTVSFAETRTHWSDRDVSRVSASVMLVLEDRSIRVSSSGSSTSCTSVTLSRPVVNGVISAIAPLFGLSSR